ncbi:MAG: GTPase [Candidatus Korarchaeum sp.]|nr:GTPase [Candidatus Korarchaeum sp.]
MKNPFSSVPEPLELEELIDISFRRAFSKPKAIGKRHNLIAEIRAREISRLQSISDTISSKLDNVVKNFPNIGNLDPFYKELLEIIGGVDEVKHSLGSIFWASRTIKRLLRFYSSRIKAENDPERIAELRREFLGRTVSVLKRVRKEIDFLKELIPRLKELPDLDTSSPTVIIAGMPNTGKSTLLSKMTTKKPEIAPYPFTTKGLIIGHRGLNSLGNIQFIDTPGLLDRPLMERNKMELQAIAALRHFKGLVLYILDPTETCGYRLTQQLSLLRELIATLKKEYLAVLNKYDLFENFRENFARAEDELSRIGVKSLRISAEMGEGLEELIRNIEETLRGH